MNGDICDKILPMPINLNRLSKKEIISRAQFRCKHNHSGLEHPGCFMVEPERIGFFDIETQGLDAGFGIMLSWAMKPAASENVRSDVITLKDISKGKNADEDKRIVISAIEEIKKYDLIITHYGNDYRFDIPFLRTRAVSLNVDFPGYGSLNHRDTYTILKRKFKLNRNRLESAARVLLGETEKNHIDPAIWRKAGRGDKKALEYVLDHNKRDVRELERVYNRIEGFVKGGNTSI